MVHFRWPGLALLLLVGGGGPAVAQASRPAPRVELGENEPNPFFPATTIPFTIPVEVCAGGHRPTVSLRIYNVLVQLVAVPVLVGPPGVAVDSVRLSCGEHRAHWDGKYLDGVGEVTPGVYYFQLTVDRERYTRKMIAQRRVTSQQ
jgi:hypothetical protein